MKKKLKSMLKTLIIVMLALSLTGCWNRVRIEEILQHELDIMRRYGHPAALLMLDLDKFKQINDQFGQSCW